MKLFFVSFLFIVLLNAKGTLSGEKIENQATVGFNLNGDNHLIQSNIDSFVVDKIVDIKLNWQDSTPVSVASNEKDRVLTFLLTNLGNGKDTIKLTDIIDTKKSFTPPPTNIRLYQDSNNNGIFDSSDKKVSQLTLDADNNKTLFIVSDIPEGNQTINSEAFVGIKATSTATNSSGADNPNKVDTVIRNKEKSEYGIYKIRDCWLEAIQSGELIGDDNKTHTGSIIEYTIKLSIGGDSKGKKIKDINVTDPIPDKTLYIPNSLKLNGKTLKDSEYLKDDTIVINNLTISNDSVQEIKFRVQVQ